MGAILAAMAAPVLGAGSTVGDLAVDDSIVASLAVAGSAVIDLAMAVAGGGTAAGGPDGKTTGGGLTGGAAITIPHRIARSHPLVSAATDMPALIRA